MKTAMTTQFSRVLLATVAAATLAACAQTPMPETAMNRHAIQVAESIERLEIYPRAEGLDLTSRDRDAMHSFLAGYSNQGRGPVYINVPSNGTAGISSAQSQVRQALHGVGLSAVEVQEGRYNTQPGAPAPLVVSYRRLKALSPDCNAGGEDLSATFYNTPSPNWGCAYYANIAAMVADPEQFLGPYNMTPPSSRRRMVVYDKYIKGEPTSATKTDEQRISSQEPQGN